MNQIFPLSCCYFFFLLFQFISNFLAIASAWNFSAFFQIISNFYMPSFQLLLKSAPSFTPMSSYPPQFPEFSGVSVFFYLKCLFLFQEALCIFHVLKVLPSCSLSIKYFLTHALFSSSRKLVLLVHWSDFHTSVPYSAANIIFFF